MSELSIDRYTGNGVNTDFTVTFGYLNKAHVKVYLNALLQTAGVGYNWLTDTTIRFTSAPANGVPIVIDRDTPTEAKIVDFENASVLTAENLDQTVDQLLYISQEAKDTAGSVVENSANIDIVAANITAVVTDAANIANINTVASNIANINLVAGDLPTLNGYAPLASPVFTGSPTAPSPPAGLGTIVYNTRLSTTQWVRDYLVTNVGEDKYVRGVGLELPLGTIEGLRISRDGTNPNTHLSIAAGAATIFDSTNSVVRFARQTSSAFVKRVDQAWAIGSGNGGRFSGSLSANQAWHVFIMRRNSDGLVDIGLSTSSAGSDAPAGWSVRRIGSWLLDGSSNLRNIYQTGNIFTHNALS